MIPKEKDLRIENPKAVKGVSMALMDKKKIYLHDPFGLLGNHMSKSNLSACKIRPSACGHHWIFNMSSQNPGMELNQNTPGVFIDDILVDLPSQMLILRPRSLVTEIGCNRNTNKEEIKPFLHDVLNQFSLASASLSDLLTPWERIEQRIESAARADFVIVLYNPKSKRRDWQLESAQKIILKHRPGSTPVGIVTRAMREGQDVRIVRLENLHTTPVDMQTAVFVGSSASIEYLDFMITPRGYASKYSIDEQEW